MSLTVRPDLQTGFVAQEVEQAAKDLNYDFSGVVAPQNDLDNYSLRYSEFVVPLVQATKELHEMIKTQAKQIKVLESELAKLKKRGQQ